MKKGLSQEIVNWEYLGSVLAQGDDEEQARFFKSFVAECKSWGTNYQVQGQLASVNLKLTSEERETLAMLGFNED